MPSVTADEVAVELTTDTTRYDQGLDRAVATFDGAMAKILGRAGKVGSSLDTIFAISGRAGVVGLVASYGAGAISSLSGISDAIERQRNILRAAGVDAESLASVYERLADVARRYSQSTKDVVETFGELAAVGRIVGATQTQVMQMTESFSALAKASGQTLSQISGAMTSFEGAIVLARVSLGSFNSLAKQSPLILESVAKGLREAGGSVTQLRDLIRAGEVSGQAFFRAFLAGSDVIDRGATASVALLGTSMALARDAGNRLLESLDRMLGVSTALKTVLDGLAGVFDSFRGAVESVDGWVNRLSESVKGLSGNLPGLSGFMMRALRIPINPPAQETPAPQSRLGGFAAPGVAPTVSTTDYPVPSQAGRGGRSREDAYARERRQMEDQIRLNNLEAESIRLTEFERDKARATLELENAARQAGIALSPQQRAELDQLAEGYARSAEAARQAQSQIEAIHALQREFGQAAIEGITGLIDGTKTLNDVLADTLKRFAQLALQALILGEGPLGTLFGMQGGKNQAGGLIGTLSGLFRANGGPVQQGRPYVVGEQGPELFVPGRSGSVVANSALRSSVPTPMGGLIVNADMRDSSAPAIAVLSQRIDRLERSLPAIVQQSVQQGRSVNPFFAG